MGGAGSFGLGEVDVTALGSTVGHAAKPSSEAFWLWLDGPIMGLNWIEVLKPSSEAFGFGWMDLMGLGWIKVLMRYAETLRATHCHSFSRSSFVALSFPLASPSSLGEGSADLV